MSDRPRDLVQFQTKVCGPHIKISFATKIRDGLHFVDDNPWAAAYIGLIPYGPNSFLVNSRICAAFHGIKRNSWNRNFQQHHFDLEKHYPISQELRERYPNIALSPQTWLRRIFKLGSFNERSSDAEIAIATKMAASSRRKYVQVSEPFEGDVGDADDFGQFNECLFQDEENDQF
jgi:hypothetical protein